MKPYEGLRKGQFSTFLKPIVIMVFGVLLISLLTTSLNFNLGLQQERSSIKFQSTPSQIFTDVANCLSVNDPLSGGSYLLSQEKLENMEKKYNFREPECAESFRYGYEVSVKQSFLRSVKIADTGGEKIDLVFVMDTSGSMSNDISDLCQVKSDVVNILKDRGADVEFTVYGLGATPQCASQSIPLHVEDWAPGTAWAVNNHDWRSGSKKIIFPMSDECPENGNGCSGDGDSVDNAVSTASSQSIEVYPVWGSGIGGQAKEFMKELAQGTGGEASSKGSASNLADFIVEAAGAGGKNYVGGESTCTMPPVKTYEGSAQIVFAADASASFPDEWNSICSRVQTTIDELEAKGLKTNVSIYVPGQPGGKNNGEGGAMSGYDFTSGNVPSCVASAENNAVSSKYGKGITEWNGTGLVNYKPSKDFGLEAWGVFSKWILENHQWNQSADKRMMFVIGDYDPTGGGSTSDFRTIDGTDVLDNETEIVRNVTNLSDNKHVNIYTVAGDMEYTGTDMYGDPSKNDAVELMERTASKTGGEFMRYSNSDQIPSMIKKMFVSFESSDSQGSRTCRNATYNFGEMHGSKATNTGGILRSTFPASIRQSGNLTTPATVKITLRQGSIEKLAGGINKAIKTGKRLNENTTVYVSLSNSKALTVGSHQIQRQETTDYILQNPGGDKVISVDDDLIIGVNGEKVFSERSGAPSNIDFSNPANQFKAYKGASLQLIAINSKNPSLRLDKLELACAPGEQCSGTQTLNNATIQASKNSNPTEYTELGGIGSFFHNFTTVKIGETNTLTRKSVCYEGSNQCIVLRSNSVPSLEIRPGSHNIRIKYSPSNGVTIDK